MGRLTLPGRRRDRPGLEGPRHAARPPSRIRTSRDRPPSAPTRPVPNPRGSSRRRPRRYFAVDAPPSRRLLEGGPGRQRMPAPTGHRVVGQVVLQRHVHRAGEVARLVGGAAVGRVQVPPDVKEDGGVPPSMSRSSSVAVTSTSERTPTKVRLPTCPSRRSTSTPISARASGSGGWATTTPCSTSSPVRTWRAASTPAIPPNWRASCRAAARRGVRIGAQVGYRDLAGFGRRYIDMAPDDLTADVHVPDRRAAGAGARSRLGGHLRQTPWRAVQHDRHRSRPGSAPSPRPCTPSTHGLPVLGLARLGVLRRGRRNSACAPCRGLRRPGLSTRRATGLAARAGRGAARRRRRSRTGWRRWSPTAAVVAVDGSTIPITVESVCVHGDSPGAVRIATAVRERLAADGVALAAFV